MCTREPGSCTRDRLRLTVGISLNHLPPYSLGQITLVNQLAQGMFTLTFGHMVPVTTRHLVTAGDLASSPTVVCSALPAKLLPCSFHPCIPHPCSPCFCFSKLRPKSKQYCFCLECFTCKSLLFYVCRLCFVCINIQCARRPEEGADSVRTGGTDGWELPGGCWELNLGPREEQPVLLPPRPAPHCLLSGLRLSPL